MFSAEQFFIILCVAAPGKREGPLCCSFAKVSKPVLVNAEKLITSLWYTQTGAVSCMDCLPSQTLFLHGLEPCHFHLTKPVSALAVTRPSSLMPKSVTTLPEQHVLLAALGMLPNIQLHIMVCHLTIGTSGYKQTSKQEFTLLIQIPTYMGKV